MSSSPQPQATSTGKCSTRYYSSIINIVCCRIYACVVMYSAYRYIVDTLVLLSILLQCVVLLMLAIIALQHSFSTPHFIIIRSVARLRYLLGYCRCEFLACILFRMRGTVLVVVDSARDTKDSSVTAARESTSQVIT